MFRQIKKRFLINLSSRSFNSHNVSTNNLRQKMCISIYNSQHLNVTKMLPTNRLSTINQHQNYRQMSYDNKNATHIKINDLITKSKKKVFVFMKGNPSEPLCRYSGVVVQILDAYGVDFDSADVLADEDIRTEIKSYSDWPTIPQVFVEGSFVGGCDILLQMHQSGELKQLFSSDKTATATATAKPDESSKN